ncbi:hypothetical protein MMC29_001507 [Sticta canariensis]|nr:hypothetical protein [Sticta canariensis]
MNLRTSGSPASLPPQAHSTGKRNWEMRKMLDKNLRPKRQRLQAALQATLAQPPVGPIVQHEKRLPANAYPGHYMPYQTAKSAEQAPLKPSQAETQNQYLSEQRRHLSVSAKPPAGLQIHTHQQGHAHTQQAPQPDQYDHGLAAKQVGADSVIPSNGQWQSNAHTECLSSEDAPMLIALKSPG